MMKTIIALILLCGVVTAQPFIIAPLVWNESGNLEACVHITYTFGDQSFEQITADDGSCAFDCQNFDGINEGDKITVSCKYGTKTATINYNEFGQGVTFNEPSSVAAIAVFAAMGFVAIVAFGRKGVYWLRKKIKKTDKE